MDEQNLLYEISRRLNSDLDIDRVLADVLQMTSKCIGADNGSILILDEKGNVSHKILTRRNMAPEKIKFVLHEVLSQGLAGWVVKHRQGQVVHDVTQDEQWVNFPDDDFVGGSAISVPLLHRDRLVGVLTLRHKHTSYFTDDLLTLLSVIADQSAAAIENARLFDVVQAERAKLEAIISGAGDGVLVTDHEGHILVMNPVARRLFGIAHDADMQGQFLLDEIDNASLWALWHSRTLTKYAFTTELPLQDDRTLYASITQVSDVGFVITMQDITYFKELDKLKDDFVSTVSHDLRSPLQLICTYTSLLTDIGPLNQRQTEFVEGINRSVKKMSDLIDELLDLARVSAGMGMEKALCDLNESIVRVFEQFKDMAQSKGLSLQSELAAGPVLVEANVRRIDQVLSNLVDNAIKYTPTGQITLQTRIDDTKAYVSIQDTGIGLTPEEQECLFVKFYRARNDYTAEIDGTGLGLVIAKSIVEQYGGQMWVESVWQQGSTFGFSLPKSE